MWAPNWAHNTQANDFVMADASWMAIANESKKLDVCQKRQPVYEK